MQANDTSDIALLGNVRRATDVLETIAADWGLLDRLPAEIRERLHRAVAGVHNPDPHARRIRVKAAERQRKAAETTRDDAGTRRDGNQGAAQAAGVYHAECLSARSLRTM